MVEEKLFRVTDRPYPAAEIPDVVYDARPDWVALYHLAWRQAWAHVYESAQTPVSPYMGEGIGTNRIWIWDTCFMAHFCRYAPHVFPGIQSMDNFYRVLHGSSS